MHSIDDIDALFCESNETSFSEEVDESKEFDIYVDDSKEFCEKAAMYSCNQCGFETIKRNGLKIHTYKAQT